MYGLQLTVCTLNVWLAVDSYNTMVAVRSGGPIFHHLDDTQEEWSLTLVLAVLYQVVKTRVSGAV